MATPWASADAVMDCAPNLVWTHIDGVDAWVYLDPRRFTFMQYCGYEHLIFDFQMHEERLTGVKGWTRQWQRWTSKGTIVLSTVGTRIDSPFVRCFEESGYERKLSDLLDAYCPSKVDMSKL